MPKAVEKSDEKPVIGSVEKPVERQYRDYVLPFNQKVSYGRAWSAYDVSLYFWQTNQILP